MNRTTRALTAALSLGLASVAAHGLVSPAPVQAAAAIKTEKQGIGSRHYWRTK